MVFLYMILGMIVVVVLINGGIYKLLRLLLFIYPIIIAFSNYFFFTFTPWITASIYFLCGFLLLSPRVIKLNYQLEQYKKQVDYLSPLAAKELKDQEISKKILKQTK